MDTSLPYRAYSGVDSYADYFETQSPVTSHLIGQIPGVRVCLGPDDVRPLAELVVAHVLVDGVAAILLEHGHVQDFFIGDHA